MRSIAAAALSASLVVASSGCRGSSAEGAGRFEPFARAYRIERRDQLIAGATATAQVGDLLIENDQIRVAIVGAFESLAPNLYGGSLVDADLARVNGNGQVGPGHDELGEVFPVVDIRVPRPDAPDPDAPGGSTRTVQPLASSVSVLEPGGSGAGARAVVRVEADLAPLLAVTGLIPLDLDTSTVRLVHDYVLEPGRRSLTIRTEVQYRPDGSAPRDPFTPTRRFEARYTDEPLGVLVPILAGQAFGDIALFGGGTSFFSNDFGFDLLTAQLQPSANPTPDAPWDETRPFRNTFAAPLTGELLAGIGQRVSYGMTTPRGRMSIPLVADPVVPQFYATSLDVVDPATGRRPDPPAGAPGDAITYERYFIVGHGDVASVADEAYALRGVATGRVVGQALEAGTGRARARTSVLAFAHPREPRSGALLDPERLTARDLGNPVSQFLTDARLDDAVVDGSFGGTLPPGPYLFVALSAGRGRSRPVPVVVPAGETTRVAIEVPRSGRIAVTVRDGTRPGEAVPAKITVTELDGHGVPWPRFGESGLPIARLPRPGAIVEPQTVDASRSDLEFIADYAHTSDGRHTFELEPGRYRVYASRGYEYSMATADVDVIAGLEASADLAIARVVDTSGWLAADFHVHSSSSHDASCPKESRVRGLAAEGLEVFGATDHDYVSDYTPVIESLGLRGRLRALVGDELTTFETGHYNGMPVRYDLGLPANGAPGWIGLGTPQIFDTLRAIGTNGPDQTLTIANHPRSSSSGYFSQFAFDQGTGVVCGDNFLTYGNPTVREGFFGRVKLENFCLDCFAAMEVLNGKRLEQIRTPTLEELPEIADGQTEPPPAVPLYRVLERTMDEQRRLLDTGDLLALTDSGSAQGGVDDLFAVLNLGPRPTGVGDSDAHSCRDSGRGHSWIRAETDLPDAADDLEVVGTVARGRVTMGFGPFVTARIGNAGVGDTVTDRDGLLELDVLVQGPDWFQIDRVEVYLNGELATERRVPRPNPAGAKFRERIPLDVRAVSINAGAARDTHVVVVALGDDSLFPVNFPQAEPSGDPLTDGFSTIAPSLFLSSSLARTYDVPPYGVTNPIFVDVDGDGRFTPVGRPPSNGRFKLAQCDGAARPEDCACESIELPPDALLAELLEYADLVEGRRLQGQLHGRLAAERTVAP